MKTDKGGNKIKSIIKWKIQVFSLNALKEIDWFSKIKENYKDSQLNKRKIKNWIELTEMSQIEELQEKQLILKDKDRKLELESKLKDKTFNLLGMDK